MQDSLLKLNLKVSNRLLFFQEYDLTAKFYTILQCYRYFISSSICLQFMQAT
jgi:hypothetical protein